MVKTREFAGFAFSVTWVSKHMWDVFHGFGRELEMLLDVLVGPQLSKFAENGQNTAAFVGPR